MGAGSVSNTGDGTLTTWDDGLDEDFAPRSTVRSSLLIPDSASPKDFPSALRSIYESLRGKITGITHPLSHKNLKNVMEAARKLYPISDASLEEAPALASELGARQVFVLKLPPELGKYAAEYSEDPNSPENFGVVAALMLLEKKPDLLSGVLTYVGPLDQQAGVEVLYKLNPDVFLAGVPMPKRIDPQDPNQQEAYKQQVADKKNSEILETMAGTGYGKEAATVLAAVLNGAAGFFTGQTVILNLTGAHADEDELKQLRNHNEVKYYWVKEYAGFAPYLRSIRRRIWEQVGDDKKRSAMLGYLNEAVSGHPTLARSLYQLIEVYEACMAESKEKNEQAAKLEARLTAPLLRHLEERYQHQYHWPKLMPERLTRLLSLSFNQALQILEDALLKASDDVSAHTGVIATVIARFKKGELPEENELDLARRRLQEILGLAPSGHVPHLQAAEAVLDVLEELSRVSPLPSADSDPADMPRAADSVRADSDFKRTRLEDPEKLLPQAAEPLPGGTWRVVREAFKEHYFVKSPEHHRPRHLILSPLSGDLTVEQVIFLIRGRFYLVSASLIQGRVAAFKGDVERWLAAVDKRVKLAPPKGISALKILPPNKPVAKKSDLSPLLKDSPPKKRPYFSIAGVGFAPINTVNRTWSGPGVPSEGSPLPEDPDKLKGMQMIQPPNNVRLIQTTGIIQPETAGYAGQLAHDLKHEPAHRLTRTSRSRRLRAHSFSRTRTRKNCSMPQRARRSRALARMARRSIPRSVR